MTYCFSLQWLCLQTLYSLHILHWSQTLVCEAQCHLVDLDQGSYQVQRQEYCRRRSFHVAKSQSGTSPLGASRGVGFSFILTATALDVGELSMLLSPIIAVVEALIGVVSTFCLLPAVIKCSISVGNTCPSFVA